MPTKIYGWSDDLIEAQGDIIEVEANYTIFENSALLICSDNTILEVKHNHSRLGLWQITLLRKGNLFDRIDVCTGDGDIKNTDIAYFHNGLESVIFTNEWLYMR